MANFANADMVGHTGHFAAAVTAVEALDVAVGRVAQAVLALDAAEPDGGALLCITADHGNADEMTDAAGHTVTAHSLNPVPLLLAGSCVRGARLRDGVLADVAPTLLARAGLDPAPGMTGRDLLEPRAAD